MGALLTRKVLIAYGVAAVAGLIWMKIKPVNINDIGIGLVAGIIVGFDFTFRFFRQKLAQLQLQNQWYAAQFYGGHGGPLELTAGQGQYAEAPGQYTEYPDYPHTGPWQYGQPGHENYGDTDT